MLVVGAFDDAGNATIRIRIGGPVAIQSYIAIIDTGFSGCRVLRGKSEGHHFHLRHRDEAGSSMFGLDIET
jgi:hypothetical protein